MLPILINIFLLISIIGFVTFNVWEYLYSAIQHPTGWLAFVLNMLPDVIDKIILWTLTLLAFISSLVISSTIFIAFTNIIAAPFYGILAQKVELIYNDKLIDSENNIKSYLKIIPKAMFREARKLLHYIPWLLITLIVFLIPITTAFTPIVWFISMSWLLAVQYIDYAADNQQISFKETLITLKTKPFTVLGFGLITSFLITIPGLNIFIPPAAVAGGTKLWLDLNKSR